MGGDGVVHEAAGRDAVGRQFAAGAAGDTDIERRDRQGPCLRSLHGCRSPAEPPPQVSRRLRAGLPKPMHPARRRDLRPWRRACRQQWQVSWLADRAQPACLPGMLPSGARRVALRLQLRGQPRRCTAFPFHLPHGRTIAVSCMTGCVTGQIKAALTFVLGGARSGKSAHAEALVTALPAPWRYVATAQAFDDEMRARIAEHRARRDERWHTVEAPLDLAAALRCAGAGAGGLPDAVADQPDAGRTCSPTGRRCSRPWMRARRRR